MSHRDDTGLCQRKAKRVFKGAIVRIPSSRDDFLEEETETSTIPSTGNKLLDRAYEFLQPSELKGITLWKGACVECYGSAVLTFMSSLSVQTGVNSTLQFPPLAIAIFNGLLLTLIIYACAAPSGGHINPLITISTLFVGLTSPMRALLYVPFQMCGSATGSLFFRSGLAAWGEKTTAREMAGCVLGEDMTLAQVFCIEVGASFFIFIVGFGCALNPTASKVYGPIYAPLLIGAAVALVIFGSSALYPGYTGAGVNPARCFGPALVSWDEWETYWVVYFLGPLCAAVFHAPFYLFTPPDHALPKPETTTPSLVPGLGPDNASSDRDESSQKSCMDAAEKSV